MGRKTRAGEHAAVEGNVFPRFCGIYGKRAWRSHIQCIDLCIIFMVYKIHTHTEFFADIIKELFVVAEIFLLNIPFKREQ